MRSWECLMKYTMNAMIMSAFIPPTIPHVTCRQVFGSSLGIIFSIIYISYSSSRPPIRRSSWMFPGGTNITSSIDCGLLWIGVFSVELPSVEAISKQIARLIWGRLMGMWHLHYSVNIHDFQEDSQ